VRYIAMIPKHVCTPKPRAFENLHIQSLMVLYVVFWATRATCGFVLKYGLALDALSKVIGVVKTALRRAGNVPEYAEDRGVIEVIVDGVIPSVIAVWKKLLIKERMTHRLSPIKKG
jgi:hypothetical protein